MSVAPQTIALSLVSHTNVGKTTLARTLLGRDVGSVRDEPHVTQAAEQYTMAETQTGDRLVLWDTPGFGDSVRLARRLERSVNPIVWLLAEVWDRFRDRPFWSSQQAVRNVRQQADIVLYLVSAAEDPREAGYVAPEIQVLDWVGQAGDRAAQSARRAAAGGRGGPRGAALARASGGCALRARCVAARCVRSLLGAGGHPVRRDRTGAVASQAAGVCTPARRMAYAPPRHFRRDDASSGAASRACGE